MTTENEKSLEDPIKVIASKICYIHGNLHPNDIIPELQAVAREAVRRDPVRRMLIELFPDPDENENVRFERIAELFYKDTGYLRPGKSDPEKDTSSSENVDRFNKWYHDKCRIALAAAKGGE